MRRLVFALLVIAACDNAVDPTLRDLSFLVVSGDGQSGTVGQLLPEPLVIKATDDRGKTLRRVLVEFRVTSGGGTTSSPSIETTDNQGIAQVWWRLGTSTAQAQLVEVRLVSDGRLVGSFSATALPGPAVNLSRLPPDSQSTPRLTAVPIPPAVRVTDQFGNPIAGIVVTFTVPSSDSGASVTGSPAVTNSAGTATVGSWVLGRTVGAHSIFVTAAGVTGVASYTALATLGAGARMTIFAGDNQVIPVGTTLPINLAVRITDVANAPIPGVLPTWTFISGSGGNFGGPGTSDANGVSALGPFFICCTRAITVMRVTLAGSSDTVFFHEIATAASPKNISVSAGNGQTTRPGTPVLVPPAAVVRDTFNNPVPGVSVTFAVTQGGGSVTGTPALTDTNGIATVGSWTLGPNDGPNALQATASGVPVGANFTATGHVEPVDSANTTLTVTPSTITVSAGSEVATITVTARDASYRPVPYAPTVLNVGIQQFLDTTDANGVATMTFSSTVAGGLLVYAVVEGVATIRRFLSVRSAAPFSIAVNAGNNQTAVAGTPVAVAPAVVVRDTFGNGANTVGVAFAVTGGGGSITGPSTINTTAIGIATLGGWTLGVTPGPNTLTATVVGTSLTTTFAATGIDNAASVEISAGDGQIVPPRATVPIPPAVLARDAAGNPMTGAVVDFVPAPGSGALSGPATQTTGADGTARVGGWTIGPYLTNKLVARVRGTNLAVTFTATGQGSHWNRLADMPTGRFTHGAETANGVVYAVGGLDNDYRAEVEAYDPATDTWSTRAPLPSARGELGVGVIDGVLYAVGGNHDNGRSIVGTVEAYDPVTDTWTPRASLPTPRTGLAVVVSNGILYAIGGAACAPPPGQACTPSSPIDVVGTVEAYDPATDSWSTRASMPTPRVYLGAAVINGVIYAVGGEDNAPPYFMPNVEAYDPSADVWTVRAPLPTARWGLAVSVVNDVLYAMGGVGESSFQNRVIESYNPVSNSWTTGYPLMLMGREHAATTVLNGLIYLIGGNGAGQLLETFQP